MRLCLLLLISLLACACQDDPVLDPVAPDDTAEAPPSDLAVSDLGEDSEDRPDIDGDDLISTFPELQAGQVGVLVLLDGVPSSATTVTQGGAHRSVVTNDEGRVVVTIDPTVESPTLVASHPEARQRAAKISSTPVVVTIELTRYDPTDNLDYIFQDSGVPGDRESTQFCGHCHITFNNSWFVSPHRSAASNPPLHDVYAGTSSALDSPRACRDAGGSWVLGSRPGPHQPASS